MTSSAARPYDDTVPAPLPDGRYLSVAWMVRAVSGGQTRAMLLRSRAFSTATGRPADVLTIDAFSEYDQLRAELRESGLLSDNVRLLNLYEHYRAHAWGATSIGRAAGAGDGARSRRDPPP